MPVHAQSESGHELLAENLPGMYWLEFLCHSVLLVVIDNLIGVSVPPPKADAPLIVDADAVLTFAVSLQRLQPKWRWICASRSAHRRYRQWAPRHHCEHRTPLRALFQKQPYLLDESTNTLRPGNCRGQDRREGRAGRATVGNRCRPAVYEESRYEGSGPAAAHRGKDSNVPGE